MVGANGGPEPAPEIPIWVGAFKPLTLRLVGRLPTLSYLSPSDIASGNAIIHQAAEAVIGGRSAGC